MKYNKKNRAWLGSGRGNLARDLVILGVVAILFAALALSAGLLLKDDTAVVADQGVRILRVMTDNPNTCMGVSGEYRDWVELVNLSDQPVDIGGWKLFVDTDVHGAFVLPEKTLAAGESIVFYGGKAVSGAPDSSLFLNFSFKAGGAWLCLTDDKENILDNVDIPALESGNVYALDVETGTYSQRSPYDDLPVGVKLGGSLSPEYSGGVVISELMASNGSTIRDQYGAYSDWIEIYNGTDSEVSLRDWSLSDNNMNRRRFVFPDRTLAAGEYLLVFASGEENLEGELHASFKLSSGGEHLVLYNPAGEAVSYMEYDSLDKGQSLIRVGASLAQTRLPSPGNPNTAEGALASMDRDYTTMGSNALGLYINEVVSDSATRPDWIELVNQSASDINLSGFGLSDNPNKPRKWRFPEGASVPAGGYVVVALMGDDYTTEQAQGIWCADFALDSQTDQLLQLSDASGNVLDKMLLSAQRRDISYGRSDERGSYCYFATPTPGIPNSGTTYAYSAKAVRFSQIGGVQSGPVRLELFASEGETIYYTTDGTKPTVNSTVYTRPLDISSNTVVRAIAHRSDGLPSEVVGNTYLFGVHHTLGVIAVSGRSSELIESSGILNTGSNTSGHDVQVEIYDKNGHCLINQECEMTMSGKSSRVKYAQKAFRLVAKGDYGDNRFRAELFSQRDYSEYKSVVVRAAGQDNQMAMMRDVLITSLARNTSVMYQEAEPMVVYVNGSYWGVYYLRERISAHSICQFEGWENLDSVDLLESADMTVIQGSSDTYHQMMNFVRKYGVSSDENLEKLRQIMDVENYLDYVILQMYCNNQDLNNIRLYRSTEGDGKWRWILFDTDLAFRANRNCVEEWLSTSSGGKVGSITSQSNVLFVELMKNPQIEEYFLIRFGELLATDLSADSVIARIQELYNALEPEMEMECERWGWSKSTWMKEGKNLISYVQKRPATLVSQLIDEFNLNSTQAERYFGAAKATAN